MPVFAGEWKQIGQGWYYEQDGAWDGKEAVVENEVEWSGHVHLLTNEMRGGIATAYNGEELLPQYNPETQCFIARVEDGMGADMDSQGQKAQMINVPRSFDLKWNVYGNLLEFYDKSGVCEGIYWIE